MTYSAAARPRGVAPLLLLSAVAVSVTIGFAQGFWLSNLHNGLLAVAFAGVGAYVLFQRPGHREGGLFMANGLVEAVIFLGRQVGHRGSAADDRWLAWLGVWPIVVGLALATLAVIGFPDGRLPSLRWRAVVAVIAVVTTACAAMSALWPVEYSSAGVATTHPIHAIAPDGIQDLWSAVAHPAYIAFQLLWVVAVVARWRSANGHIRRQLGVLGAAVVVSFMTLVVGLIGWSSPRPGVLSATLIPVAAGLAIVHGQHLASYAALSWLSRSSGTDDLPSDFARATADALCAPGAALWMGNADRLHVIGLWPDANEDIESADLAALSADRQSQARAVMKGGQVVGALVVDRPLVDSLSAAEARLLEDLAAQAALVISHQNLADAIARERESGRLDGLSPREQEVLELISRGLSNTAICDELHLSVKTVEPLVSSVFTKLGLQADAGSNRRVLAALAYLRG